MPLTCPHCRIVQAEGSETCINCGLPLTPAEATAPQAGGAPPAGPDAASAPLARRAAWRLPALFAFGLLLALTASAFFAARRGVVRHGVVRHGVARRPAYTAPVSLPAPPAPVAVPPAPLSSASPAPSPIVRPSPAAETPATRAVRPSAGAVPLTVMPLTVTPLTVTLRSTQEGRHVKVGEGVTLTALAGGQSTTLTLFSRRGRGENTMLTFVEGSLCSTTWTPALPGRYEFTATALGDRKRSAASRRVVITVDAPAPPVEARAVPPRTAVRAAARDRSRPPALTYHVAAAKFPFLRNATVLADALSRRGYQAVPERMDDRHGKAVYVVVTGSYHDPKEARSAALELQRSGYPAYFFGGR